MLLSAAGMVLCSGATHAGTAPAATARVPPMGFNTWNAYGSHIDEQLIRTLADQMASSGLLAAGYQYLNLDDGWASAERAADGSVVADPAAFPSGMAALGAHVHGAGLLFGVYTSENPTTCAGRAGSFAHELQDAASYCAWGVDYVKVDHCGDGLHARPRMNESWVLFRRGFDACVAARGQRKRIVLSVEYCTVDVPKCASWFEHKGAPNSLDGCAAWLAEARVDLWRTKSDIRASWASVLDGASCASESRALSANMSAATRGFNDPDILEVGNPALSYAEQRSHFSLWCILAAPLLLSFDVGAASNATLQLVTNAEVIAVDQDPRAIQGAEVNCSSSSSSSSSSSNLLLATNCSAASFPTNMTGTQCMGLVEATAAGAAASLGACAAACCAMGADACETYQWCPPGHTGGPSDCAPASSCFVGTIPSAARKCHAQPGWQGRGRGAAPPTPAAGPSRAWLKPLVAKAAGAERWALLLLNEGAGSQNVTVRWDELGIGDGGTALAIRDLWEHTDLGVFASGFSTQVEAHGVVLVSLTLTRHD